MGPFFSHCNSHFSCRQDAKFRPKKKISARHLNVVYHRRGMAISTVKHSAMNSNDPLVALETARSFKLRATVLWVHSCELAVIPVENWRQDSSLQEQLKDVRASTTEYKMTLRENTRWAWYSFHPTCNFFYLCHMTLSSGSPY
jgi:hypothetical protein